MEVLYAKRFSKDLERIRHELRVKRSLLELIERITAAGTLSDLKDVRKIEGYKGDFRI